MKYGECVYNKYILCTRYPSGTESCTDMRCGWNPPTERSRILQLRQNGAHALHAKPQPPEAEESGEESGEENEP